MKRQLNVWMASLIVVFVLGLAACDGAETPTAEPLPTATATTAVLVQPYFGSYVVAVDIANLRSGPGPEYDLLGQVTQGFALELDGISEDGEWVRTTTGGWLPLGFLDEAPEVAPTTEADASDTPAPPDQPTPTLTIVPPASPTWTATVLVTVVAPTTCGPPAGWVIYLVQSGDTLFSIASQTGTSVATLMRANCLTSDRINAGQGLYVPRLPIPTPTFTYTPLPASPTATQMPTAVDTPTATFTATPTQTATQLPPDSPTPTDSATVQPPISGTP